MPRRLFEDRKHSWAEVTRELADRANADGGFVRNIATGDETWVYGYDVETETQSWQWVY